MPRITITSISHHLPLDSDSMKPLKRIELEMELEKRNPDVSDEEYAHMLGVEFLKALEDYQINQRTKPN